MELFLRAYTLLNKLVNFLLTPFLILIFDFNKSKTESLPNIDNPILEICAVDLAEKIRNKEISSEKVVYEYINRIKKIEPFINAVIEDRFEDAINDAKRADKVIAETSPIYVVRNFPLLGVPFTVKESIGLKGCSYVGGSIARIGTKATRDAVVVQKLKSAGAIPLLVSNTPEYCTSWECNNLVFGRTLNPYNSGRTSGGSSGGEGALNGAGATVFGIGSDVAGSIRVPSMFNGIFGHKPTAGLVSLDSHFPSSSDKNFNNYLTIGPMCRYAKDLPTLMYLMAEEEFQPLLRLDQPLHTKDIKIYYLTSAGFSFCLWNVEHSIQVKLLEAVSHFKSNGLHCEQGDFFCDLTETLEISIATFFDMEDIPDLLSNTKMSKPKDLLSELGKSIIGRSEYSFYGLFFRALHATKNILIRPSKKDYYINRGIELKQKMLDKLGTDGVLFYPTFPQAAMRHCESPTKMSGVMYTMFFNLMGFPSTHVPMGKDANGLPIGFQVIAAPYQDRNCFAIARELEAAFGGWKL
ncbi:CLUMA_CG015295, isoform A [Clunio marinus]|uniref:CLUMA_CG015295, isoform A n=1 Tax=Clunio marinus TaxID=568069 RepID=A0A1J1IQM9_9DIPT|nr:CLUMA_CG015295, isoform A [Clunio marinus]